MKRRLKHCPFCGGKAALSCWQSDLTSMWIGRIECLDCMAEMTEVGDSQNQAIHKVTKSWNKRVGDSKL